MTTKKKGSKSSIKSKGSKKVVKKDPPSPAIPISSVITKEPEVIDTGPQAEPGMGAEFMDMLKDTVTVDGVELKKVFESTNEQPALTGPDEALQPGDMITQPGAFDPKNPIAGAGAERAEHRKVPQAATLEKMEKYVVSLREFGNPTRAAQAVGITRYQAYYWRSTYPGFAKVWSMAMNMAIDDLEAEARRRAFEGVLKPVGWYKGVAGGRIREYSDLLIMFLLKAYRPDKFKDRIEATGAGVLGVRVQITDYSGTRPETVDKPNSSTHNDSKDDRSPEGGA